MCSKCPFFLPDPQIKAKVRHYLSSSANPFVDIETHNNGDSYHHPPALEDVTRSNGDSMENSVPPQPRYEAFVMTGDRVLKLSKNQQGSILPKQRKVRSNLYILYIPITISIYFSLARQPLHHIGPLILFTNLGEINSLSAESK